MAIQGSCLCGAVRYEISGSFDIAGHCHCSLCRKSHGAAFASHAHVDPEQFRWTAGVEQVQKYESSPGGERCFCQRCGSMLAVTEARKVSWVTLGTVDGDPGIRPSGHVFVGSKAPWYEITDTLPQFEEWPPGMNS